MKNKFDSIKFDNSFMNKADDYKRDLIHSAVRPTREVDFINSKTAFQELDVKQTGDYKAGFSLERGESIILDFGDHYTGYLNMDLTNDPRRIVDSPIQLRFSFGEFPLEIVTPADSYKGTLGSGWLQNEIKSIVFMPYSGTLERRYSFRYLKIERLDNSVNGVIFNDIFVDAVSAVKLSDVKTPEITDPELKKIYDISVNTLKECEQDVFEDGPKRDRRLWIGDLRLQALTDYYTFRNYDLIKRCIYLFSACRTEEGLVVSCVFPDTPPYFDGWGFLDYSLFYISCLYDYTVHGGGAEDIRPLYDIAFRQAEIVSSSLNDDGILVGRDCFEDFYFIDWCEGLDKTVAFLGVYIYTLRQLLALAEMLGRDTAFISDEISKSEKKLMRFYSNEKGLFVTPSGQISWHSQVWAVLSGVLSFEASAALLKQTKTVNPEYIMHAPYMMHYYIEALFSVGLKDEAMEFIKENWSKIANLGFDCFPEVFNPNNHFESPYNAPEINSACHAWSCTPAYWINKIYSDK